MDRSVVVCGLACRLPDSNDIETLRSTVEAGAKLEVQGRKIVKDIIDITQFSVHPHQAENLDPQIRVLLHCAYEALVDACITHLPRKKTGCIMACPVSDFGETVGYDIKAMSGYGVLGGCRAMISNRISFELDLQGPSYTLDSGNSLIALHNGCKLIESGRCDFVIVGGVEMTLKSRYSECVALLSDGIQRCEGAVAIVLARGDLAKKAYGSIFKTTTTFLKPLKDCLVEAFWEQLLSIPKEYEVEIIGNASWDREIELIEKRCLVKLGKDISYTYKGNLLREAFGDLGSLSGLVGVLISIFNKGKAVSIVSSYGITGMYGGVVLGHPPTGYRFYDTGTLPRFMGLTAINEETAKSIFASYSLKGSWQYSYLQQAFQDTRLRSDTKVRAVFDNFNKLVEVVPARKVRPLWIVVSGVGGNWEGMGKNLLKYPVFSNSVKRSISYLRERISFEELINDPIKNVKNMFLALILFQIGLIDLLLDLEVEFDGFLGHSFGEIAALYACGALTHYQTVKCAEFRGDATETSARGAMLAVLNKQPFKSWNEVEQSILVKHGVEVACNNSSTCMVVSGKTDQVLSCRTALESCGHRCILLESANKAFHSRLMDACVERYKTSLSTILPRKTLASSRFHSSSQPHSKTLFISPRYFAINLRRPVRFSEVLARNLPQDAIVVEVSPHAILSRHIKKDFPKVETISVSDSKNQYAFEEAVKRLFLLGKHINLTRMPLTEYGFHQNNGIRHSPRDLVNAGSLLQWNSSSRWYVPLPEHFPESTLPNPIETSSSRPVQPSQPAQPDGGALHSTFDVSQYQLNDPLSPVKLLYCVIQQLSRFLKGGLIVRGKPATSLCKRSSNNFLDVFYFEGLRELVVEYNNTLYFRGTCVLLPGQYISDPSTLKELELVEQGYGISGDMVLSTAPVSSPHLACTVRSKTNHLVLTFEGQVRQKQCPGLLESCHPLVKRVKQILGLSEVPDFGRKLKNYGIDSLMSTEIRTLLQISGNIIIDEMMVSELDFNYFVEVSKSINFN